jgi:hypothetical protein
MAVSMGGWRRPMRWTIGTKNGGKYFGVGVGSGVVVGIGVIVSVGVSVIVAVGICVGVEVGRGVLVGTSVGLGRGGGHAGRPGRPQHLPVAGSH